jgi:hypothetical protein
MDSLSILTTMKKDIRKISDPRTYYKKEKYIAPMKQTALEIVLF